ncbi:MAG: YybH family protein [Solirubrobacterales bacterium]
MATLVATETPEEATRAFAASLTRGDLQAAAGCFVKDACLVTPDATTVRGREDIRSILRQLIASGSRIEVQESSMLLAGEVAFGTERWLITTPGSEGKSFTRALTPRLVLRRLDGVWKLAVAMPWSRG